MMMSSLFKSSESHDKSKPEQLSAFEISSKLDEKELNFIIFSTFQFKIKF